MPKSADLLSYPLWAKKGKKSCLDYAKDRMENILKTRSDEASLPPSQEEEIERILKEAREYYRRKGMITDGEWEAMQEDLKSIDYPFA